MHVCMEDAMFVLGYCWKSEIHSHKTFRVGHSSTLTTLDYFSHTFQQRICRPLSFAFTARPHVDKLNFQSLCDVDRFA